MKRLTATYRLQLRNGVTFDVAAKLVPALADMGFSHLYLSPIFAATPGSTHGYDITNPQEIDPVLGGETGYRQLASVAKAHDIGVILDIVPNHTAFSIDNPWLCDVLQHGEASAFADHFDIDWTDRLVLPWLPETFDTLVRKGEIKIRDKHMVVGDLSVPLAPDTDPSDIAAAHDAQVWRLTHWQHERDGVTHRRFFSVTGLIGMSVEKAHVFDAMHKKVLELIGEGATQGLRVDHIDGLADPAAYLERLKAHVGDTPVWIEKILTGDEKLPKSWPVAGTTGYEAARQIARVLTVPSGHRQLLDAWADETDDRRAFQDAVLEAKREVVTGELAAELHQLIALAQDLVDADGIEAGPETVREVIIALLVHFPRYRSYLNASTASQTDVDLLKAVADAAAHEIDNRAALDLVVRQMLAPDTPVAHRLQTRFQQVTGALVAKSHEDTAAFRQTAYLAACEVGADPDEVTISAPDMQAWCDARTHTALTLTSSHDTKRSEDARMRLVAMSHCPHQSLSLIENAARLPEAGMIGPRERWYVVQAALAIWTSDNEPPVRRLRAHMRKALREAALLTRWTDPDLKAEAKILDFAEALVKGWGQHPPDELGDIIAVADHLSLAQVVLRMLIPGVPDIYQSCLRADFSLTDPDNRRPVDFALLGKPPIKEGLSRNKYQLTRALLDLRRDDFQVLQQGSTLWSHDASGIVVVRSAQGRKIEVCINHETLDIAVTMNGAPVHFGATGDVLHV